MAVSAEADLRSFMQVAAACADSALLERVCARRGGSLAAFEDAAVGLDGEDDCGGGGGEAATGSPDRRTGSEL